MITPVIKFYSMNSNRHTDMARKHKPEYQGANPADYRLTDGQFAEIARGIEGVSVDVGAAERLAAASAAGHVSTPINNMGGRSESDVPTLEETSEGTERFNYDRVVHLMTGRGPVELTLKAGWGGDLAHIDAVSFTFHESTLDRHSPGKTLLAPEEFAVAASTLLYKIFGFGITGKRDKGLNYYQNTWLLGDGYGFVSHGGQRETMLVQITGTGCACASSGWEKRLHDFLQDGCIRAKITRVDLAFDDLEGSYTVDKAFEDVKAGLYTVGGRRTPSIEQRGDWLNPDGSGRTLYVGKRSNGKFCRIYEKGKEQGDENSPWVRCEVELKSIDRIIPYDVLIDAGRYFAGCYPAFQRFEGLKAPCRIETYTRTLAAAYEHLEHHARLQVGRLVNFMKSVRGMTSDEIVKTLSRKDGSLPDRIKLEKVHSDFIDVRKYLHETLPNTVQDYLGFKIPKSKWIDKTFGAATENFNGHSYALVQ